MSVSFNFVLLIQVVLAHLLVLTKDKLADLYIVAKTTKPFVVKNCYIL